MSRNLCPPGPVMIDIQGHAVTREERELLATPATGAVILFSRNYRSVAQIIELIAEIRSVRPGLLIAVDHEGGRVQRFREGFTRLPAAAWYAESDDPALTEQAGWLMASELRAIDIDFSFAPVLDVESGISQVIGDRSFGSDPATVVRQAGAFMTGMHRAGMAAVAKHFPGHGGVREDSHLALPVDHRTLEQLEQCDLIPFRSLIPHHLEGVMPAHVIYPEIDSRPAGFSPTWIREVLRKDLGFQGAIFSDDLSMAGAAFAGGPVERAHMALDAGCDMILVCNAPGAAREVLESLANRPPDPERLTRLEAMRGRFPVDRNQLLASSEWQESARMINSITTQVT